MSKCVKIIILVAAGIVLIAGITALLYFFLPGRLPETAAAPKTEAGYTEEKGAADRLHFLNTGSSDCIIIESNGHYALVDAAEDSDYPAGMENLIYDGYEDDIVAYLLANCADENGNVTIDFIVGTHAHSDHLGGFDTIINHEKISVKKAYLKEYHAENIRSYEIKRWDNQQVYDQTIAALTDAGAEIVSDITATPFAFEDFTITIFNGDYDTSGKKKGENENSLGVLVEKAGKRAFLAGDMNHLRDNDEKRLAPEIGKIDLLKAGHHGYVGSTSRYWAKTLQPSITIITNSEQRVYGCVRRVLTNVGSYMYPTVENDGICAYFTDDGHIILDKTYCMNVK